MQTAIAFDITTEDHINAQSSCGTNIQFDFLCALIGNIMVSSAPIPNDKENRIKVLLSFAVFALTKFHFISGCPQTSSQIFYIRIVFSCEMEFVKGLFCKTQCF